MIEIEYLHKNQETLLYVTLKGALKGREYEVFIPQLESDLNSAKQLRLLFEICDLNLKKHSLWRTLSFNPPLNRSVLKLAIIGEVIWQDWMALACLPLAAAERQCFLPAQKEQALIWVGS